MTYYAPLSSPPPEVTRHAEGESVDFCVKAKRSSAAALAFGGILFSAVWLLISGGVGVAFLGPLLFAKEVHFKLNGKPVTASLDNFGPLIFPSIFIAVFLLIGLVILFFSIRGLLKKGPWILATPNRLVEIYEDEVKSYDWEKFTGTTFVKGENITLEMRTGRMVRRKHGPSRYVPDKLYIIGVPDVFSIDQLCRKRIKENDPTPSGV